MTDNRTTELLRKMLDERGVEYETNDHMGAFETRWNGFTATQISENANLLMSVTPEQAIAATLGEEKAGRKSPPKGGPGPCGQPSDDIIHDVHDAATLGSGTLTAEQVREAVMSADRWEKPIGNTGMTNTHLIIRDDDWQAIADELNATTGGEKCEWTLKEKWLNRTGDDHVYGYETSCGARHTWWPDSLPNYCPNCGKAVKR